MAVIVVTAVIFDLATKTWAENNLASSSTQWVHGLPAVVTEEDHGTTVRDFVVREFNIDLDDKVEAPAVDWLYQVDPTGARPASPIRANYVLDDRVTDVELRYRAINVIDGFWTYTYAENTGAAFGFLSGKAEWFRRPFFLIVSILAMGMIFSLYRKVPDDKRILQVALAAVVGGALGNFIDRVRYGYVVDFIDWYITIGGEEKHWPTFNIADVYISCGVTVMAVLILFGYADFEPEKAVAAPAAPTPLESGRVVGSTGGISLVDDGSAGLGGESSGEGGADT